MNAVLLWALFYSLIQGLVYAWQHMTTTAWFQMLQVLKALQSHLKQLVQLCLLLFHFSFEYCSACRESEQFPFQHSWFTDRTNSFHKAILVAITEKRGEKQLYHMLLVRLEICFTQKSKFGGAEMRADVDWKKTHKWQSLIMLPLYQAQLLVLINCLRPQSTYLRLVPSFKCCLNHWGHSLDLGSHRQFFLHQSDSIAFDSYWIAPYSISPHLKK